MHNAKADRKLEYHAWLNSDDWREFRAKVIKTLGRRCALTGRVLTDRQINVHHFRYNFGRLPKDPHHCVILSRNAHRYLHALKAQGLVNEFDEQGLRIARCLMLDGKGPRNLLNRLLRQLPKNFSTNIAIASPSFG
jgi:hypothetical protein